MSFRMNPSRSAGWTPESSTRARKPGAHPGASAVPGHGSSSNTYRNSILSHYLMALWPMASPNIYLSWEPHTRLHSSLQSWLRASDSPPLNGCRLSQASSQPPRSRPLLLALLHDLQRPQKGPKSVEPTENRNRERGFMKKTPTSAHQYEYQVLQTGFQPELSQTLKAATTPKDGRCPA